jgi:hypothetical protein
MAYKSGRKIPPLSFSCTNYGQFIDKYMESINVLSERRWGKILGGVENQPEDDFDAFSLSENRHNLVTPSSPSKATDDE